MARQKLQRLHPEAEFPVIDLRGSVEACAQRLGYVWADALRHAAPPESDTRPAWWQQRRFKKIIARHAPHLPALFQGMARGAGLPEHAVGDRALLAERDGCTSFAIQPAATLDRHPISGQTKDTPAQRIYNYQVLKLNFTDAPPALTLTYPGWLFGHGFVRGGCSIFRNSIYTGKPPAGQLPYAAWGLLALHCTNVDDVVKLTRDLGVDECFHTAVADEQGGVVGIECARAGVGVLKPRRGIYTHANAVMAGKKLQQHEQADERYNRDNSLHRQSQLRARFEENHGRLTAQLACIAMADHTRYPDGICRHQSEDALTTAAIVAEPTLGLLHVTHGPPCRNWPRTYRLD